MSDATHWVPWFPMPAVVHNLRSMVVDTYMSDYDVGEMFSMLEPNLRPYTGVDSTWLSPEEVSATNLVIRRYRERILMGFSPSPYLVTKDLVEVGWMIRDYKKLSGKILEWKKVILNIPGIYHYDPSIPWVYKVGLYNKIATYIFFYIDDERLTAC